jgi:hypothetical protein
MFKGLILLKTEGPRAGKCPNFSHHPNIGDVISNGYFFK